MLGQWPQVGAVSFVWVWCHTEASTRSPQSIRSSSGLSDCMLAPADANWGGGGFTYWGCVIDIRVNARAIFSGPQVKVYFLFLFWKASQQTCWPVLWWFYTNRNFIVFLWECGCSVSFLHVQPHVDSRAFQILVTFLWHQTKQGLVSSPSHTPLPLLYMTIITFNECFYLCWPPVGIFCLCLSDVPGLRWAPEHQPVDPTSLLSLVQIFYQKIFLLRSKDGSWSLVQLTEVWYS